MVDIIAIGASAGGTEAMAHILKELPAELPPVILTMHIPPMFSKMFADRMNSISRLTVHEAEQGDMLLPGHVLVSPGDLHSKVVRAGSGYRVELFHGPKVRFVRPSVDVTFNSVAETVGANALGVILTGMGDDGARGLLLMRQMGAWTIGQDRESSLVYGMPKEAFRMGGVCEVASLKDIPKLIVERARQKGKSSSAGNGRI